MMDDVLELIVSIGDGVDEEGNPTPKERKRTAFCQVSSVGRSEYYQAAQADLHPEYIFKLSNYKDYRGEKLVRYIDWLGKEHILYVTRTYRVPDEDSIELTCEERTGDGDF